mmetsp:Transcript_26754/g.53761  ORF Transcript_26754/g.53761 Transcript_26754/m.53761 type:complete len:251 (+) Transcript_26754:204-956(+)
MLRMRCTVDSTAVPLSSRTAYTDNTQAAVGTSLRKCARDSTMRHVWCPRTSQTRRGLGQAMVAVTCAERSGAMVKQSGGVGGLTLLATRSHPHPDPHPKPSLILTHSAAGMAKTSPSNASSLSYQPPNCPVHPYYAISRPNSRRKPPSAPCSVICSPSLVDPGDPAASVKVEASAISRSVGAAPGSREGTSPASSCSYVRPISSLVASCSSPGKSCCSMSYVAVTTPSSGAPAISGANLSSAVDSERGAG